MNKEIFDLTIKLRKEISVFSPIFSNPNPPFDVEERILEPELRVVMTVEDLYLWKIMQERGYNNVEFNYPSSLTSEERSIFEDIVYGRGKFAAIAEQILHPTPFVMILSNEILSELSYPFHIEYIKNRIAPMVSLKDVSLFFASYHARSAESAFMRYEEKKSIWAILIALAQEVTNIYFDDDVALSQFVPLPQHQRLFFREDDFLI